MREAELELGLSLLSQHGAPYDRINKRLENVVNNYYGTMIASTEGAGFRYQGDRNFCEHPHARICNGSVLDLGAKVQKCTFGSMLMAQKSKSVSMVTAK